MSTLDASWYADPTVNFPWDASVNFSIGGDLGVKSKLKELLYSKHGTGFYCAHCHEWHGNEEAVSWRTCGHLFGRECALQIVNEVIPDSTGNPAMASWSSNREPLIPRCEAIVGVFQHTQPMQPKYCITPLQEAEAVAMGVTRYQLEVIRNLNSAGSLVVSSNV